MTSNSSTWIIELIDGADLVVIVSCQSDGEYWQACAESAWKWQKTDVQRVLPNTHAIEFVRPPVGEYRSPDSALVAALEAIAVHRSMASAAMRRVLGLEPSPASERSRVGVVVFAGNSKTRKVEIAWKDRHPKIGKYVSKRTRLQVHDELEMSRLGDTVEIAACRPISRMKHHTFIRVVARSPEAALNEYGGSDSAWSQGHL